MRPWPGVRDALELYKLVEKEKKHSDLRIDSVGIMVGKADKDEVVGALYFEFPNYGSEATNVVTLGYVAILGNIQIYDLSGNLCRVEEKRLGDSAASYSIHLPQEVQPGEHFKVIVVVNLEDLPLLNNFQDIATQLFFMKNGHAALSSYFPGLQFDYIALRVRQIDKRQPADPLDFSCRNFTHMTAAMVEDSISGLTHV